MEKIAYGPLNLYPAIFYSLTPKEFSNLIEGYRWRLEQENNRITEQAWLTAYFQRVKKLPNLNKLLNNKKTEPKRVSPEEKEKIFKEMRDIFN